ncbi:uncharacterized protein LOC6558758 [Drosophila grimshawi]|uniref:uncharacterized protein LOC6558758 n=1 Tax=Drosophila grimshawi TaxID=7222 RepID=UPI000C8705B5|nr:uncharacterized protein LOC6558758 [Drosophila grimshawi]
MADRIETKDLPAVLKIESNLGDGDGDGIRLEQQSNGDDSLNLGSESRFSTDELEQRMRQRLEKLAAYENAQNEVAIDQNVGSKKTLTSDVSEWPDIIENPTHRINTLSQL